jgi:hypothetical protein
MLFIEVLMRGRDRAKFYVLPWQKNILAMTINMYRP